MGQVLCWILGDVSPTPRRHRVGQNHALLLGCQDRGDNVLVAKA